MAMTSRRIRVDPSPVGPPIEATLAAFAAAWWAGESPRAEDWLSRVDPGRSEEAVELIYQEFCLAESAGLSPRPDDFLGRFPAHRKALATLFALRSLGPTEVWDDDPASALPEVGDEIGTYTLIRELGRGSFARVFLAEQADLASRPVVLKATTRPSPEPSRLARARHAHIVEVLHYADVDGGALQIVCMPFLGGATLGVVSAASGRRPKSGADFLARLDRVSAPEYPRADVPRPAREILGRLSYPKAVAWIFARLAEALDHAHRRGVAHGDLKPSNILITADALPMLFDFNLSVDWRDDDEEVGGGTLAYMPPERLLAVALARNGVKRRGSRADLHRADVYSLGLVLVETLTGVSPAISSSCEPAELAKLREGGTTAFTDWARLPIPAGLRPILAHCLAADPACRHADGRSLAEDLDRWRSDLAPINAPDAPWPVPMARWARRRRTPIAATALTLVVAATAVGFTSSLFRTTVRGQAAAKYARLLDKGDAGLFNFRQFVDWAPALGDPAELAARKLNPYDVLNDADWRLRDDVRSLPELDRTDLKMLILEQVYRISSAWSYRPDSPGDWSRALALLDRESRHARNPTFDALRASLRSRPGVVGQVGNPHTEGVAPWVESYLAGVAVEAQSAREALAYFDRAIELRPDLLWPRYRAASAAYRLANSEASARHLRILAIQRPENPAILTQLAAALTRERRPEEAIGPVERAIAIDPEFAEAYRNRALLDAPPIPDRGPDAARYAVLKRLSGLAEGEKLGLHTLTSRMFGQDDDLSTASDLVQKILAVDPANPDFRCVRACFLERSGRVRQALDAYDEVLRVHPDHLRARYGRAQARLKLGEPGAVDEAARLVEDSRFEELFREDPDALLMVHRVTRALLKEARIDRARSLAELGLAFSRRFSRLEAESLYQLARVDALTTDASRDDLARHRLRQAAGLSPIVRGWFADDLAFVRLRRDDPAFLKPLP